MHKYEGVHEDGEAWKKVKEWRVNVEEEPSEGMPEEWSVNEKEGRNAGEIVAGRGRKE